jgi:protein-S-isoprenylcysteine O-methyltransferase Ste14
VKGQYLANNSWACRFLADIGVLLLAVFCLGLPTPASAADITLTVKVNASDDLVTVKVTNTGRDKAVLLRVSSELDGKSYSAAARTILEPGTNHTTEIRVALPLHDGSYPLITRLYYLNEGKELSIVDAGYFNFRRTEHLAADCTLPNITLAGKTAVELPAVKDYRFTLILPDEIKIEQQLSAGSRIRYVLQSLHPEFNSNYAVYGVLQTPAQFAVQAAKICSARLVTTQILTRKWFIPGWFICCGAFMGFVVAWLCYKRTGQRVLNYREIIAARYGFSLFLISLIYLAFRNAHVLARLIEPYVYLSQEGGRLGGYLRLAAQVLVKWLYFQGRDYDQFFNFVADPLYLYMLLGNGFVLCYLVKPDPESDKYFHLMRTFFSLPGLRSVLRTNFDAGFHWSALTRLAILSLAVKAFYLPLLCSWSINQAGYVYRLVSSANWQFYAVNSVLVEVLILVDVLIFALGYLTELPGLRNTIRSVEPTILGWVVCLMCYPPFNSFSFALFDQPLNEYWTPAFGMAHLLVAGVITILWTIYLWATVALGFKSSNLTNRGIVADGPYRFIRHPAYAAKVSLWILSSFFMGEKNFFLVVAFVVVYTLRAWTEERHLSRDPEYLEYKKKVPWVLIPKVF